MTITINIPYMDIAVLASFITIGLFLFQVLRFLYKWVFIIYKILQKNVADVAADVHTPVKKGNDNDPVEKADHETHSKGG